MRYNSDTWRQDLFTYYYLISSFKRIHSSDIENLLLD